MLIEDWPLDRVRPYPNNPRVLRNAAEKVADSIREFGWRQPIVVDEEGVIVIGHSRLAAAQLLKLQAVPVHVARGLSPEKIRALRIADNKTAEFAGWDEGKLADELAAILEGAGDVTTGFSRSEFEAIEMRAMAELERITRAAPAVAVAPAAPAAAPAAAPEEGAEEGEDDDQAPSASTAPAGPELVPFHALMTVDDRAALYDAIAAAKERHGLQLSAEALGVVARAYLDA